MTNYVITEEQRQMLLDILQPASYGSPLTTARGILQSLTPVDAEPVAWMNAKRDMTFLHIKSDIPLYTHPAPLGELTPVDTESDSDHLTIAYLDGYHKGRDARLRELSDEEILRHIACTAKESSHYVMFARAVIKAAKETK